MAKKIIYHYDRVTSNYVGSSEALESPLEPGFFLIPAFATDVKPPKITDNQMAKFSDGKWSIKEAREGVEH